MKNLDTIIKLLDAGYNKADIEELLAEDPKNENQDIEASKNENQDTLAENQSIAGIDKLAEALDGLNAKIKDLDASIKKGNILNSQLNIPKEQSAEDILASILTPDKK